MQWIRDGIATGVMWYDPASGWRELEDGTTSGGAMWTRFFQPAAVGLPDDFTLVAPDEMENLARIVGGAATRWSRRIRVALGPELPGSAWSAGSPATRKRQAGCCLRSLNGSRRTASGRRGTSSGTPSATPRRGSPAKRLPSALTATASVLHGVRSRPRTGSSGAGGLRARKPRP